MLKFGAIAAALGFFAGWAAALPTRLVQAIHVTVDGQAVSFPEAQPRMEGGMIFVPLRGVFEQMGANVRWDAVQRNVIVEKGSHTITMRAEGKSAMVDNRAVNLSGRAHIEKGNVMVPLRFVATALGSQVGWDPATMTVTIATDGHFIDGSRKPARPPVGGG